MKLKLLTFLIVVFGFIFYIFQNNTTNKFDDNIEQINKEQIHEIKENKIEKEVTENESNNEPITNNKQDNNKTSGISSDSTSITNNDDKKSNTNINSNVVKEKEVKNNSKQVKNNSTQVENSSTSKVEKQTPWDELGITENDYYNKPMWSWARIDYSIKEYKTQELAQKACIEDGNNMLDEILSFSCTSINSYSGDYLGEMLRVKY